jgi:hypothetical protein
MALDHMNLLAMFGTLASRRAVVRRLSHMLAPTRRAPEPIVLSLFRRQVACICAVYAVKAVRECRNPQQTQLQNGKGKALPAGPFWRISRAIVDPNWRIVPHLGRPESSGASLI